MSRITEGIKGAINKLRNASASHVYDYLFSRKVLGITYILMIPAFACIYTFFMPNDFYHATISYEKEAVLLKNQVGTILKKISSTGISGMSGIARSNTIDANGIVHFTVYEKVGTERLSGPASFEFQKLTFDIDSVDDKQLNFLIKFPLGRYDRPKPTKPENCCFVDRQPGVGNYRVPTADCITSLNWVFSNRLSMICRPLDRGIFTAPDELGSLPSWFDSLFLKFDLEGIPKNHQAYILGDLGEGDEEQFRTYVNLHGGLNEALEGRFVRMLYFSAVTITTLGYGDIVPITNRARMAIALESIIGLIIIGLFISSLAKPATGKSGINTEDN